MVLFGRCMGWCMVKGIWLLFQSSRHQEAIRLKGRPSWSQAAGCAPWSILQPKKLHILCHHLTWIAAVLLVITHGKQGLVKWEPRQTWHCSWLAQCSIVQNCTKLLLLSMNYQSAVDTGLPWANTVPLLCYGTHRSTRTNTVPLLYCGTHRSPQLTPYPSFAVVSTGLPCHFIVLHSTHTSSCNMYII